MNGAKCKLFFSVRVVLAVIFIVSGYLKLMEPYQNFLAAVYAYKILPAAAAKAFAIGMPWVELIFGVYLLAGLWTRFSLEVLWFLNSLFIAAVASALFRKLPISECGCFGGAASFPLDKILWLDGALWTVFALLFFFSEDAKWLSLDEYFRKKQ